MREKKAATGFEPVNGGFADRSLNHLGTPPQAILSIPINVRADTNDTGDLSVLATDCNMPGCISIASQSMDQRASGLRQGWDWNGGAACLTNAGVGHKFD